MVLFARWGQDCSESPSVRWELEIWCYQARADAHLMKLESQIRVTDPNTPELAANVSLH